jgi:hypothetical protein
MKLGICILIHVFLLVSFACNRWDCNKKPNEFARLSFKLIDKITNQYILRYPAPEVYEVTDSIQLKNLHTNTKNFLRHLLQVIVLLFMLIPIKG